MFTTIQSKIIVSVLVLTSLLGLALLLIGKDLYHNYKELRIAQCRAVVAEKTEELADTIRSLDTNARELALIGELLLRERGPGSADLAEYAVTQNFNINKEALGGGLWYVPYGFDKKRELTCFYAFKKNGVAVFDPDFSSRSYFYPGQNWYREAIEDFMARKSNIRDVIWSPAYTDAAGTRTLMTTASAAIIDANNEIAGLATIDWSLEAMARKIASIKPTPGSLTVFADIAHGIILGRGNTKHQQNSCLDPLQSLPWFNANAPQEQTLSINGNNYLSFSRKFDNGMMVMVNVPENELFHALNQGLRITLLVLLGTMLASAAITWLLLDRFISKPVMRLCRAAAEVGRGNLDQAFIPSSSDEIGSLAGSFAAMASNLKNHIAQIETITAERSRIDAELNVAKNIQAAMLPTGFPSLDACSLAALMRPAREIGGDFYDFFFIGERQLVVVMADVSGKGVPAALFMAIACTRIRNCVRTWPEPGTALTEANKGLCENNSANMFVTAFIGILDIDSGNFRYANAAHNPFYLCEASGKFKRVSLKPALPLGAMDNTVYDTCNLKLFPGSSVFLYTDGVTEATNEKGDFFGNAGLERSLAAGIPLLHRDLPAFIASILTNLDEFSCGACQSDDITMLAFSFMPGSYARGGLDTKSSRTEEPYFQREKNYPATLEALPDFMTLVEDALEAGKFTEQQRMRFSVAAEEIFVNIVNYAYTDPEIPAVIEISLQLSEKPAILHLRFTDFGIAFNPLESAPPDLAMPAGERSIGGLGIFLAGKGTSSLQYTREANMNILTMILEKDNKNAKP